MQQTILKNDKYIKDLVYTHISKKDLLQHPEYRDICNQQESLIDRMFLEKHERNSHKLYQLLKDRKTNYTWYYIQHKKPEIRFKKAYEILQHVIAVKNEPLHHEPTGRMSHYKGQSIILLDEGVMNTMDAHTFLHFLYTCGTTKSMEPLSDKRYVIVTNEHTPQMFFQELMERTAEPELSYHYKANLKNILDEINVIAL